MNKLTVVFIVATIGISIGAEQWTEIGPSGGSVICMKSFPDNPQIMLCGLLNGGAYKSTDRGETWKQIQTKPIYDLALLEEGIAYLAGHEGLFISRNYGETWNQVFDHITWQVVATSNGIVAADTMTVARTHWYYRDQARDAWLLSYDYGETWKEWEGTLLKHPTYIFTLEPGMKRGSILFHENGTVFRAEGDYVYKSDGLNWNTWIFLGNTNTWAPAYLQFACTIEDDSIFWGFSRYFDFHPGGFLDGGLFKSLDWCQTWKKIKLSISATALTKKDSMLFIGDEDGNLYLYDIWNEHNKLTGEFGGEITSIDATRWKQGELIVSTKGGIYKTVDDGLNWQKSDFGIYHIATNAVQVIPTGEITERIILAVKNAGICISDDDGGNWLWAAKMPVILPGLLQKSPSNPNVIYAGGAVIFYSEDGGVNWNKINSFPASYYDWYGRVVDIDIFPDNPDHIIVHFYDHSLDHYKGILFADGYKTFYQDPDWDWELKYWFDADYNKSYKAQFDIGNNLLWISQQHLWEEKAIPALQAIDLTSQDIIHPITLPDNLVANFWLINENNVYIFNERSDIFWHSTDLGENWVKTKLQHSEYKHYDDWAAYQPLGQLTLSPDKASIFFLYPGNGVLISRDQGLTWETLNEGLSSDEIYQIEFSSLNPSVAYVTTSHGFYRRNIITSVDNITDPKANPKDYFLFQNYPNPFNTQTKIQFFLARSTKVQLKIFDLIGRHVIDLVDQTLPAGNHEIDWNGLDKFSNPVPSGIYLYQIKAENKFSDNQKMILLK